MKNATVTTDSDFDCAPFGYVPYRVISTCTCEPEVLEDFWMCVDTVLATHNLTSPVLCLNLSSSNKSILMSLSIIKAFHFLRVKILRISARVAYIIRIAYKQVNPQHERHRHLDRTNNLLLPVAFHHHHRSRLNKYHKI